MQTPLTRTDLLAEIIGERAMWDALLDEVGEARMDEPGADGEWSVKETIAHVMGWERWGAAEARRVARGEPYLPDEAGPFDVDDLNRRFVAPCRERPVHEVRAAENEVYGELIGAVNALSDDQLAQRGRYPWAPDAPFAETIADQTFAHYQEHEPRIRAWLDAKGATERR